MLQAVWETLGWYLPPGLITPALVLDEEPLIPIPLSPVGSWAPSTVLSSLHPLNFPCWPGGNT